MRLSDFFYFNKNDRIVLVWLIAIIACIAGIIFFVEDKPKGMYSQNTTDGRTQGGNYNSYENQDGVYGNHPIANIPGTGQGGQLRPFDLNRETPEQLAALGFTEREIRSVMNYRSKGGIYRHVEQMSKISGMTKGEYDRFAPYFRVSDDLRPASDFVSVPTSSYRPGQSYPRYSAPSATQSQSPGYNTPAQSQAAQTAEAKPEEVKPKPYPEKLKPGETVPINTADTTLLKRIPGVGTTYAKMIVNYRQKLGGFYSVSQLNDLQAIPAEIQQYLSLDPVPLRKIAVNKLTINKMVSHPYINFYKAQAIKDHIRQNGPLKSIRELQLNRNFSQQDIERLEYYIDYTP